jgi:hypothetical protein
MWPEKSLLRKIDSSQITLMNESFPIVPGVDVMYKCYRGKNKQQKFWFLMPVNKTQSDKERMQHLAEKYVTLDTSYFVSLVGYIDDNKLMGLLFERGKTTLQKRLSPEFTISFFESRKKFHVSFQERLLMCHKLLQGYMTNFNISNFMQPQDISLKNVMIKQDHGVWIAKWILPTTTSTTTMTTTTTSVSSTSSSMKRLILFKFGMLIKQILEWRLCPDPDPENPSHEYKHIWNLQSVFKEIQESKIKVDNKKNKKDDDGGSKKEKEKGESREYDITSLTLVIDRCFLHTSSSQGQDSIGCVGRQDQDNEYFSLNDLDLALLIFKRHYLFF